MDLGAAGRAEACAAALGRAEVGEAGDEYRLPCVNLDDDELRDLVAELVDLLVWRTL